MWNIPFDFKESIPFLTCVLIAVAAIFALQRRPRNFPPGPRGLPFVGFAPFVGKNIAETLRKLGSKYGAVMSVQMGRKDWVILNSYKAIHEALVNCGNKFSGRPDTLNFISDGYGVASADYGPVWKELRKFGHTTLRGFGVGRKSMEQNVIEEAPFLIEQLASKNGIPLHVKVTWAVSNIICRIVFGSRFQYDDNRFTGLLTSMRTYFISTLGSRTVRMIVAAPFLRYLPVFSRAWATSQSALAKFLDRIGEFLDEHKKTYNGNDIRDFIDAFLREIEERGSNDPSFSDDQLVQYIRDLMEAGTGTTRTTLCWCFLSLAQNPHFQDEIAEEIENTIGSNGIPSMDRREEMPFTCAFIQEIQRHRTLVPLGIYRKAAEDCRILGYDIPKNTTVMPNIWAVHFDDEIFENAAEFRPERFIDSDGKFINSPYVIPFSTGPRICPGEQLARMELFVFLTSILQKLRIVPDPEHPLPSFHEGEYKVLAYEGQPFEVKFEPR